MGSLWLKLESASGDDGGGTRKRIRSGSSCSSGNANRSSIVCTSGPATREAKGAGRPVSKDEGGPFVVPSDPGTRRVSVCESGRHDGDSRKSSPRPDPPGETRLDPPIADSVGRADSSVEPPTNSAASPSGLTSNEPGGTRDSSCSNSNCLRSQGG